MVDVTINGVISFPKLSKEFEKDFNDLLEKHSAYFQGSIRSYEFDEAEIFDEKVNS